MKRTTQAGNSIGRGRAVVLGASMAGLLAARVLTEAFDQVVMVDRDDLSGAGPRKGVPQAHHAHGILAKGRQLFEELFPGLTRDLVEAGGTVLDLPNEVAWFNGARPLARTPSDLLGLSVSRPALEAYIRGRVARLPAVQVRARHEVVGLRTTADHRAIAGVRLVRSGCELEEDLAADLVIDATGRGSKVSWPADLGYRRPPEDTVRAGIVYVTRQYVRDEPLPSGAVAMINSLSPAYPCGVVLIPLEGSRWNLTLIGIGDQLPPTGGDAFHEYTSKLPLSDLRVLRNAQPLTDPRLFRLPQSVRRRYERLSDLPGGYVVLGDALCSFNPAYGQGMTVAAVETVILRDCLRENREDVPRRFYQQAARFLDVPWGMASGGDLAFPTSVGHRTAKTRILSAYMARVVRAAETDESVSLAFHQTVNLISGPAQLLSARMILRVLRS